MWCIIVRNANGEYIREMEEERPDQTTLDYWESHHSVYRIDPKAPYYDNSYSVNATVVNVFEIAESVKENSEW